jgi:EAL domain-containing protein (putative c-di-GMP-specific phosphodiesterase class I)
MTTSPPALPTDDGLPVGSLPARDADPSLSDADIAAFQRLLDNRDVHAVFQPVVDLVSGEVVGLEALARGPQGSALASPLMLFAAARACGRVAELDWACRAAAFTSLLAASLPPAMSLFVNVEPEAFTEACPRDLQPVIAKAESLLRVFVEVNDRALAADPAGVLAAVDRARDMGWGVAVDDIGASRAPVAMLPLLQADVVKLDLRALEAASPGDAAGIVTSLLRHIEKTGASLLVEGIEAPEDLAWAQALGATYGQGHHIGAPGAVPERILPPRTPVRLVETTASSIDVETPFDAFAGTAQQRVDAATLRRLAEMVAFTPRSGGTWPVYLLGVGRTKALADPIVDHIISLPRQTLMTAAFGTGLGPAPAPGIRGVLLRDDDRLADELFLIVLTDEAPVALFSRVTWDGQLEAVITQDPSVVFALASHLMRRIPPTSSRSNTARPVHHRRKGLNGPSTDPPERVSPDTAPSATGPKSGWRGKLTRAH